jgi:hypothetical protein
MAKGNAKSLKNGQISARIGLNPQYASGRVRALE